MSVDVLCINCQDMIAIELVEMHSKVCTQVSAHVMRLEQTAPINHIDYRIAKVKGGLEVLIGKKSCDIYDRSFMTKIIEFCNEVLGAYELNERDQNTCHKVLENLQEMEDEFRGAPCVMIYIERTKYLVFEKIQEIQSELKKFQSISVQLEQKDEIISTLREEMQFYIQRSNKIKEDLQRFRPSTGEIEAVNSDHEFSNQGSEMSFNSPPSSHISCFRPSSPSITDENIGTICVEIPEDEEARKRFYSLCLRKKMNMFSTNPYKTVSIANLFQAVMAKNIDEEKWEEHIDRELGLY